MVVIEKRVLAMLKFIHRTGSCLVSVMLSLSLILSPLSQAQAQTQVDDTEAPVLIHRQIDTGIAGELQTFLARVSDDFGVSEVTLYYRQGDSGEFTSLNMRPLIDSIGEYMIAVETSVSDYSGLQYYIEAIDESGNQTNRGFEYAPIILPLSTPTPSVTENTTPGPIVQPGTQTQEAESASDGFAFSTSTILIGIGALVAVGALVAASSGGDDDTPIETPDVDTGPDTVTLTVISDLPTAE